MLCLKRHSDAMIKAKVVLEAIIYIHAWEF